MKAISGNAFIKILRRHGWQLARIAGNHHVFVKEGEVHRIF